MEVLERPCEYINVFRHEDSVSVVFEIEAEKPFSVGQLLGEIDDRAYMNGYNWSALINWWLENEAPELTGGLDDDSEAATYVAIYDSPDDVDRAYRLADIIRDLVEDEERLSGIVRRHADEIEWD